MTDKAGSKTTEDREWLLAELANREEGAAVGSLGANEEATIRSLQAELETIADELRLPEPVNCFAAEDGCRLAIERVKRIAGKPEFSGCGLNTNDLDLQTIGPYRVEARIGQGGMGAVYRAFHVKLQRVVAIKVLPTNRGTDEKAIARFEREMATIGALHHPNIVVAHDAGVSDGMHYLVMEYIDGVDLSTLIGRVGPLAYADACEIVRQAALGLRKACNHKIVHRDIKPSNLMLASADHDSEQAVVKVLDFGLARLAPIHAEIDELTYSGQIMGTLKYMAPEQFSRSSEVDIRADIYALGATFYKLLCGSAPFSEVKFESPLALLAAVGSEDPRSLTEFRQDVPSQLVAIVKRMMAKNPEDRYATPGEVAEALEEWSVGANLAELLNRARSEDRNVPTSYRMSKRLAIPSGEPQNAGSQPSRKVAFWTGGVLILLTVLFFLLSKVFENSHSVTPDVQVARTGQPAPQVFDSVDTAIARSRSVAEWLVSQRAQFGITTHGRGFVDLQPGEKLPGDFIQLIAANLEGNKTLSDEDFARFDKLPLFTTLGLGRTNVSNEGLRHLGELPLLQHLYLAETIVADGGLKEFRRFPKLEVLHLYGTQVTDAGLEHLAGNTLLVDLSLVGCSITDDGLKQLTGLKRLKILALDRTGVTPKGVARIQQSLPECEIRSDYNQEELTEANEAFTQESAQSEDR